MRYLIDTHTFLWFVTNDSKLSHDALDLIENDANAIFLSIASLWEMGIKFSIGKLKIHKPFQEFVDEQIHVNQLQLLNIEPSHITMVSILPFHHRDPFDRMLIAQAITEKMSIISADTAFDSYGITRLW